VSPPETRPATKTADKTLYMDPINIHLNIIINQMQTMEEAACIFQDTQSSLQRRYEDYIAALLNKFTGKSGFLRSNLLGKRVDYSGRAVIIVDNADLKLGYCDIPLAIAKEIYKPQIIKDLAIRLHTHPLKVLDEYNKTYMDKDILEIIRERFKNTFVILNRQPTLHRLSMQSFKIRNVIEDNVIVIHPLNTNAFNADFDGDQMAIYVPQTIAVKDAINKMWIDKNHRSPANQSIQIKFAQDMVMGLYNISMKDSPKIKYFKIETTEALKNLFEKVLPKKYRTKENFVLFNNPLTGKNISELVDIIEERMDEYDWVEFVDQLCKEGFNNSYMSICLKDFWIDRHEPNFEEIDNNATRIIKSGARGSWTQYSQIAYKKGSISDITGRIHPHEVQVPLIDGLSRTDYFVTCYGGRKGIIDSSANTSISGYLTRKLIFLLNSVLDTEVGDCHTELGNDRYFNLHVRDKNIAKSLIGRYVKDFGFVDRYNYAQLIDKKIDLASPIFCTAKGICPVCYGKLYDVHHSKNIGIIAAQSLGERTTQLTLRTKHISGASETNTLGALEDYLNIEDGKLIAKQNGTFKEDENSKMFIFNNEEMIFDVEYESFELLIDSEHFNEGDEIANIVVKSNDIVSAVNELSKLLSSPKDTEEIETYLYKLLDIYGDYGVVNLVHFELIISKMIRERNNIYKPYRLANNEEFEKGYKLLGITKVIGLYEDALAYERFKFFIYKFLKEDKNHITTEKTLSIFNSMMNFEFDESLPKIPW
jgi:DNA-directed RNA polymerase subunit beta'